MPVDHDVHATEARKQHLSRREAIRRAAVVGGSLVWAAPAVQKIGMSGAFAQGTPPPDPPPPPPPPPPTDVHGISFVAFVFRCNGTWYKAKWEEDKALAGGSDGAGWEQLSANDKGVVPACGTNPGNWEDAIPVQNGNMTDHGPIGVSSTRASDGDVLQVTFTLPGNCLFDDGSAVVKGGQICLYPSVSGQSFTFTAPAKP